MAAPSHPHHNGWILSRLEEKYRALETPSIDLSVTTSVESCHCGASEILAKEVLVWPEQKSARTPLAAASQPTSKSTAAKFARTQKM
jgi:hypothetical protein